MLSGPVSPSRAVLATSVVDGGRAHSAGFCDNGNNRPGSPAVSLPGVQQAGVRGLMDPTQRLESLTLPVDDVLPGCRCPGQMLSCWHQRDPVRKAPAPAVHRVRLARGSAADERRWRENAADERSPSGCCRCRATSQLYPGRGVWCSSALPRAGCDGAGCRAINVSPSSRPGGCSCCSACVG